MNVVILAAGKGTRMKEHTAEKTKAMLPLFAEKKPMLQVTVENCMAAGLSHFIIVVGYRKLDIINHPFFLECEKSGLATFQFVEQSNFSGGTADAVECAGHYIRSPQFLLVFADVVASREEIGRLLHTAEETDEAIIAVRRVLDPTRYGVVEYMDLPLRTGAARGQKKRFLKRITEKSPSPPTDLINAGLYVFPLAIMDHVRKTGVSPRRERELTDSMQSFVDAGSRILLVEVEQLVDVGTKDEYEHVLAK